MVWYSIHNTHQQYVVKHTDACRVPPECIQRPNGFVHTNTYTLTHIMLPVVPVCKHTLTHTRRLDRKSKASSSLCMCARISTANTTLCADLHEKPLLKPLACVHNHRKCGVRARQAFRSKSVADANGRIRAGLRIDIITYMI